MGQTSEFAASLLIVRQTARNYKLFHALSSIMAVSTSILVCMKYALM
jgi:hypothetical protein